MIDEILLEAEEKMEKAIAGIEEELAGRLKQFMADDKIINLFSEGVLDKKYFKEYMKVKDLFELYIGWRITFFDAEKHGREDLLFYIQERKTNVLKVIRSQQKLIQKVIKQKSR